MLRFLFYRNGFCKVSRLVNIVAFQYRCIVSDKLKRNNSYHRHEYIINIRQTEFIISNVIFRSIGITAYHNNLCTSCLYFLDVAYCLSDFYIKELRRFTSTLKEDFVLMGETLHGDYNMYMNDEKCHSVTNYECCLLYTSPSPRD